MKSCEDSFLGGQAMQWLNFFTFYITNKRNDFDYITVGTDDDVMRSYQYEYNNTDIFKVGASIRYLYSFYKFLIFLVCITIRNQEMNARKFYS